MNKRLFTLWEDAYSWQRDRVGCMATLEESSGNTFACIWIRGHSSGLMWLNDACGWIKHYTAGRLIEGKIQRKVMDERKEKQYDILNDIQV